MQLCYKVCNLVFSFPLNLSLKFPGYTLIGFPTKIYHRNSNTMICYVVQIHLERRIEV